MTGAVTSPLRATAAGLAGQTAAAMPISLVGALAPELQRDLEFGDAALGAIAACFFLIAAVFAPAGGRIIDRFGAAPGMWATSALVAIGLCVQAASTSVWILVLGIVVGAFGLNLATASSNVMLIEHVPLERRGLAFGAKQAAVPLAAMLAGLALPIIALAYGWRWAFIIMLIFPLSAAVFTPRESAASVPEDFHLHREEQAEKSKKRPPAKRPPALVRLAVIGLVASASVSILSPFLVRAATETGYSTGSAGILLSVSAAFLVVSRVAWGWVLDRSAMDPITIVALLLGGGLIGQLLLASGSKATFTIGALLAYGLGWAWPGVLMVAAVHASPSNPGEASGVLQLGNFLGATMSPLIGGFVAERAGFTPVYLMAAAYAAIAIALSLLHRARSPMDSKVLF